MWRNFKLSKNPIEKSILIDNAPDHTSEAPLNKDCQIITMFLPLRYSIIGIRMYLINKNVLSKISLGSHSVWRKRIFQGQSCNKFAPDLIQNCSLFI